MLKESTSSKKKNQGGRRKSPSPFSRHRSNTGADDPEHGDKEGGFSPPQEGSSRSSSAHHSISLRSNSGPAIQHSRPHHIVNKRDKLSHQAHEDSIHPDGELDHSDSEESDIEDERQVYLNIGGYKYVTTFGTLNKVSSFFSFLTFSTLTSSLLWSRGLEVTLLHLLLRHLLAHLNYTSRL